MSFCEIDNPEDFRLDQGAKKIMPALMFKYNL